MKLTSLEIKGFKSFADRTLIHFNERITGIVGPNGCGKSNVVDSIRWVLGEQKTSMLRSEKMENLIFSGTKKRKSAGLAEVSLTFENTKNILPTEYKTITISRRLYRDGNSEYRINDVPCRLKDINNLFMDTGISSDSYAIIELGMVDEILNDRDQSRRRLFEHASGISKYKTRKKETLSKLKSTEDDLNRVMDILFEIEGQLKSLESQARRTERYYKLKDEYKLLSIELAKLKLSSYKERYAEVKSKLEGEEDNKTKLSAEISELEASLEQLKTGNLSFEQNLAAVQKKLNELVSGVNSQENERNVLTEQLRHLREKNENAANDISNSGFKREDLAKRLEDILARLTDENKMLHERQSDLNQKSTAHLQAKESYNALKVGLDERKKQYADVETRLIELEKQIAVANSNQQSLKEQFEVNKQDKLFKDDELAAVALDYNRAETEKTSLETLLANLVKKEEEVNLQIQALQQQIEEKKNQLVQENRRLDSKKNEYELTKSMVDNLEGFPEAVKFLKKNQKWVQDAVILGDIFYCDEKYRVCIENYLEPYLNYYVVQSFSDAFDGIKILGESGKGRANFFILDALQKREAAQPLISDAIIPATEIIELDKKYQPLGAYLLDDVYVVKNEADLNALCEQHPKQIFISANGKTIKSAYTASGGSLGLFEGNKIGRTKNLEKLQKEIAKITEQNRKLEKEILTLTEKSETLKQKLNREAIEQNRQKLSDANALYHGLKSKTDSLKQSIENHGQRLQNIQNQISETEKSLTEKLKLSDELKANKSQMQEKLSDEDAQFVALSQNLSELSQAFNEANLLFHQQQNKNQQLEQEKRFNETQLQQLNEQKLRNEEIVSQTESEIQKNQLRIKQIEDELLSGYENREGLKQELEEAEQAYFKSRGSITEKENTLREINRNMQNVESVLQQYKDKFNELKLELSSLKERLSIEFNVDINVILNQEIETELSLDELNDKVQATKDKIDRFGEINPMAIEAFKEMSERYQFIVEQKTDLENAKNSLLNTIDEIENTAQEKFMTAFTEVRENFIKVFRTLFSQDDDCDLVLLDAANPLESKIDIIAKPKGKRPQVIDQLSGGEKTLTATALLFSLYLQKPAPFCIFDEVDAPLDDANIDKFNNIIRDFSKDSQFIIVTHNKQTMQHVDVAYGVVMAEQGVSTVVSADFSNKKLEEVA